MPSITSVKPPLDAHTNPEDKKPIAAPQQTTLPTTSDFSLDTPLPEHIAILPLTAETLPSYRRTFSILLPIRYPDKFYSLTLSDPTSTTFSRVAIWNDELRPAKRKRPFDITNHSSSQSREAVGGMRKEAPKVVGGIQCLIQPIPNPISNSAEYQLYIQALALLSPYRGHGIATHLLDAVIGEALVRYNNIKRVYAHVWEANEEGSSWYRQRGFNVSEKLVEEYYRKLKPRGAWIVQKDIGVRDWLRVKKMSDATSALKE